MRAASRTCQPAVAHRSNFWKAARCPAWPPCWIADQMTRKPMVVGNWKMNTSLPEALALVDAMLDTLPFISGIEKMVCPPFISLAPLRDRVAGTDILLGAQNAYWETKGAFT